jgi:hypothetical protein
VRRRRVSRLERALADRRARKLIEARAGERRRFRRILLVVAAISGLALAVAAGIARGAERVPITWTAPAGARSYEAIARRPDGSELVLALSADSAGTAPLVPAAAGGMETGWALISTDWRAGAWQVRVRACNTIGCGPWSNRVICLAGLPDTLWMLDRVPGPGVREPLTGRSAKRAAGRVGWGLAPSDSLMPANILHQETVQQRERARLCELFGYWCLRGAVQPCP